MGRPKLPQTKEQIAIRLAPGTKARLSALIRAMQARGLDVPVRSEVLRTAIERGIEAMEGDLKPGRRPPREAVRDEAPPPAPAAPALKARAIPPPPHMPVPSAARPAQPVRSERAPERAAVSPPPRLVERPAPAPAPSRAPVEPPSKKPSAASAPAAPSSRRGPIPGTLADRTLRGLKEMGKSSASVPVPALCRAVWPPNPARVHEALRELRNLGLVELVAASSSEANGSDRELILTDATGAQFGSARVR